ncbi:MAG: hypothetical protein ACRBF0_13480 [Calditrichia bacterium]
MRDIFNKIKRTLLLYYWPAFRGTIIGIGIGILFAILEIILEGGSLKYDWKIVYFIIGFTLLSSFLLGGLLLFFSEYFLPWREKRLITHSKLNFLKDLEFQFDSEDYLYEGYWKSYYVLVQAESTIDAGERITITAFINPGEEQGSILDELQEKYELRFSDNYVWLIKGVRSFFTIPKRQTFEEQLNLFIDDLIHNNINPKEFDD